MSVETLLAATEASAASAVTAPPPSAPPEELKTPAEVPPVTTEGQPVDTPATEPEQDQEPDLEVIPETSGDFPKYKELFKDHPELRQIVGRERAFSELAPGGSLAELREIVQRIPSVSDAEQLVADAEVKRSFGETFREDPTTFVESLKESDPYAFQNFATRLPEILAEAEPELYKQQAKAYTDQVLTNVLLYAQQAGNQALYDAVQLIARDGLGTRLGMQPAPVTRGNSELDKLRREKQEREQSDAQAQFTSFWNQTDNVVIETTTGEISSAIKKALPQATEAQTKRMVQEAYSKSLELINQQPQTLAQIEKYRADALKGRRGIAEHKAIVSYITARMKTPVTQAVKQVVSEWTAQVLKLNHAEIEKKKTIAANSKDVGTGPQGTTSAAAGAPPANGKPRHVSDVLKELAAGTYVPKK